MDAQRIKKAVKVIVDNRKTGNSPDVEAAQINHGGVRNSQLDRPHD